ncbi:hypothetical protein [Pseudonocardia acaciae]|uniref:hypothetical protein n=1 Tax=Pseudonocardia acaciae TaxID=551276 RepID=UPI000685EE7E|nr:hypothetical protein [Pseudonocardia acaciae]
MAHRRVLLAWLALVVAMIVLYTCVPPVFFNDGAGRIAGMPEMLFWFTLMPFLAPALIGVVYLYDKWVLLRTTEDDA